MASVADGQSQVTRADLESKLREIQGDVTDTAASARSTLMMVGGVVAVVVVIVIFGLGRRAGRHRSTVVEIRRV
jgi:uncharacterized membrane protein YgaE (UPF0421/DUF939 family)